MGERKEHLNINRRTLIGAGASLLALPSCVTNRQTQLIENKRIVVDPRIELISVVQLLGGYFLLADGDTRYKAQALEYFGPYRTHRVVDQAKRLAQDSLSYDAVPDFMLRLTQPAVMEWRTGLTSDVPRGIPNRQERSIFLKSLRDFAIVSRFQNFFDQHRSLYDEAIAVIEPIVLPNVLALEAYTGATLGQWQVIAGLLLHNGGFGPSLKRNDGSLETYSIVGPLSQSRGNPDFGDYDRLQDLIVHEFAHSPVNPLGEANSDLVQQYAARFEPLRAAMEKAGAYDTWAIVVDEHIVRAVTARIAANRFGEIAGDAAVNTEVKRGFAFVPALVERLRRYESDRGRWPMLKDYYPQLLQAFA